jgi:protein-disulfide isomerase
MSPKTIPPEKKVKTIEKDTITFKKSHFYSVLVVFAFAVGVLVGYIAWGRNVVPASTAQPVVQQPVVSQAPVTPQVTAEPRVYDIETEGYPSLGPADAPITIVEFSDYQCPFCARWHEQVYQKLLAAYPDKIRFVYRNFPLSFHQNASATAGAAMCAGDQNSYWQYHDVLFKNQLLVNNEAGTVLAQGIYNQWAADLNLDVTAFEECMTSHKYRQFILDDTNYAINLPPETNGEPAVRATPTFFINGQRVVGALPLEYFKPIIDAELAKVN